MKTTTRKSKDHATTAIPTEYKGVQMKSRLEAQCAFLFDKLEWEWQYEPRSFMLPNGVSYTPDFYIPSIQAFWECRGYSTKKGEFQIEGFAGLLMAGITSDDGNHIWHYVVLRGDGEGYTFSMNNSCTRMICLLHSQPFGWQISPMGDRTAEARCVCSTSVFLTVPTGAPYVDGAVVITASTGKVLVNGFGVEEFRSSPEMGG